MWDEFIDMSESLAILFEGHFGRPKTVPFIEHPDHTNLCFESDKLDLGHISIIDKRNERGLWMMHVAAYSNINYPMPVYGFDVICSKKTVTGVFHDISPTIGGSATEEMFKHMTTPLSFNKDRNLPDWAKNIFSSNMVAVAAPNKNERKTLSYLGKTILNEWINELQDSLAQTNDSELCIAYASKLSDYCHGQLQNTNSKNVMSALGMDEDYVNTFKKFQFPY